MNLDALYEKFLKYGKVTTDSRNVEKDALFFALKGDQFDGNLYAQKALENGCSFAIIDNKKYLDGENYILVDNVLACLQELAIYHRKQLQIPIFAITGSNGKTTTKELIAAVLSKKFKVQFTQGNLNNHIGVPLTLLSMNAQTEIGIVEMGANHVSEIKKLCEIAQPNFGLITNIGKAHIEGFGSVENIKKAKKELYDYIELSKGTAMFNAGNSILNDMIDDLNVNAISFGNQKSDVNGLVLQSNTFLKLELRILQNHFNLETQIVGNYNLENVLASAAVGHYFGLKSKDIVDAIHNYNPKNNRSQFIETEKNKLIMDAYNANPTSVDAALKNFIALNLDNKCVILGDMLELGTDSVNEHETIIKIIEQQNFKQIIVVGEIYSSILVSEKIKQFNHVNDLKVWLESNNIINSNVLIKGSRGMKLESLLENL